MTTLQEPPSRTNLTKTADRNIRDVWVEYRTTRAERLRNFFIEHFHHLVRYQAERIKAKVPDEVELDDLVSAGVFGLMDAIRNFDPDRGVKFETYCAPRIRGAILDELRAMDWVPRLTRSRVHKVDTAVKQLEIELGRPPMREEIATRLKLPIEDFEKVARDAVAVGLVSLSRKWFETDNNKDVRECDILEDRRVPDPLDITVDRVVWDEVVRGFSRAERLIILLYYREDMTMKEIGRTLDLSESRVSQMHSGILKQLRARDGMRLILSHSRRRPALPYTT